MTSVVTLAGSPTPQSRVNALLTHTASRLASLGISIVPFALTDFPPEALLYGKFDDPSVIRLREAVAEADGVVVATPVYKASFAGGIKTILDLLPEAALQNHAALTLALGGSAGHLLAIDYALHPVLSALKVRHIAPGVYATSQDLSWDEQGRLTLAPALASRLGGAMDRFVAHLHHPAPFVLRVDQEAKREALPVA